MLTALTCKLILAVDLTVCLASTVYFLRCVTARVVRWTPVRWPTWWRPTWTNTSTPARNETPPDAGVATPSRTQLQSAISSGWNLASKLKFNGEPTFSFFDISTFYWMKIFFYRFSYFVRKRITQSEIVMQEPFILHKSCDLGNYCKACRLTWEGWGWGWGWGGWYERCNAQPSMSAHVVESLFQGAGWYDKLPLNGFLIA